ncbi:MAG: NAD-dependent epimerase/dehydratase family protein [Bacteroidota bacterium]|nr:NAD-dependent epimerase/dehydratase family protein [Bacteroidota bacterium]
MKHTILGAGGSIGNALTNELLKTNESIRLVSRSNYSVTGTESFRADITSYEETLNSIKGSDIVYLLAGLPYDRKVWIKWWPKIMKNVIDACKNYDAKLIFFDNVYMYGKVDGKMTETTSYSPCSVKGEVRAIVANMLHTEMEHDNIQAIIARSADFYGPYASNSSVLYFLVLDKMMKNKKAQWIADETKLHSFTYTQDCAKALNLLRKKSDCYQQVWHLPTYSPAITGKSFIDLIAEELEVVPNYTVLKKWMLSPMGLFNRTVFESLEMIYQSEYDYLFDSTKFNEYFNFKPTTYKTGIHETIEFYRGK